MMLQVYLWCFVNIAGPFVLTNFGVIKMAIS